VPGGLWVALVLECATNIDEIASIHPEPDPALHPDLAAVSAAIDPVAPLGDPMRRQPKAAIMAETSA